MFITLVTAKTRNSPDRPQEVCHAANQNNVTDQGGRGHNQPVAKAPVPYQGPAKRGENGLSFPPGAFCFSVQGTNTKGWASSDASALEKKVLAISIHTSPYLPSRRGLRGAELDVSNTPLRARCWSWEVAGNAHKHPFCSLFPLPSFQPRHIGLSGLVFRGACGLKGQPKHLTSAVWIAQLG